MVTPSSWFSFWKISMISRACGLCRLPVGSSARMSLGAFTTARASGSGDTASLLRRAITHTTDEQLEQLVSMLYINVLSRYPSEEEKTAAYAALKDGNRQQRAEDLLWALLNKVDFFFNY